MSSLRDKQIILHIGHAKTGTTTLQRTFASNRSLLERHGIFYPVQSGGINHKRLVPLWTEKSVQASLEGRNLGSVQRQIKYAEQEWSKILDRFRSSSFNQLLISSELLFAAFGNNDISRLKDCLKATEAETKIIAYIREPTAAFLSNVQQKLKSKPDIRIPAPNHIRKCLSAYEAAGIGEIHALKFQREQFRDGSIVSDFCDRFLPTLPVFELQAVDDGKPSLSAEGMAILQAHLRGERELRFIGALGRVRRTNFVMHHDNRVPGFTRPKLHDRVHDAYRYYVTDYDWLAERFQIEFPDGDHTAVQIDGAHKLLHSIKDVRDLCHVDEDRLAELKETLCRNRHSFGQIKKFLHKAKRKLRG